MSTETEAETEARLTAIKDDAASHFSARIEGALDLFVDMNNELIELGRIIREAQPKKRGAITLDLQACGTRRCSGCPHARWLKWVKRNSKYPDQADYLVAVKIDHPKRHARARHIPDYAREAIARADLVLEQRGRLIERIRSLGRTVINLETHRFED